MLDLDITLVIQLVNFFIALFFLNILLIRPIRDIIRQRNTLMDNIASEADNFHSEAVKKLENYEAQLAAARKEAGQNREEGKNEGLAELQAIVGQAQQSARQLLDDNRQALQGHADQALNELRNGIHGFSEKVGKKLIG